MMSLNSPCRNPDYFFGVYTEAFKIRKETKTLHVRLFKILVLIALSANDNIPNMQRVIINTPNESNCGVHDYT